MNKHKMVEKFLCPGCVVGVNTKCGKYRSQYQNEGEEGSCGSWVAGTTLLGVGTFALGLPKGFNRVGTTFRTDPMTGKLELTSAVKMEVRLHPKSAPPPTWDRLNVAVWAMEKDGFLFVRTYSPRVNRSYVDVIEGGTLDMCPGALNVGEFADEID